MALRYVVRSAAISGFQAEAGDAATAIMHEAGIQPEQLELADLPLDVNQLQRLLAIASLRLQRPDLGLSLARHQDLDMLGLLGKVLRSASTLQEAFTIAQRYMSLHSNAEHWQLQSFAGQIHIIRVEHGTPPPEAKQYHEMSLAVFHRLAQLICGQPLRPLRATFAHSQVGSLKHYAQHLNCDVLFDQEHDSLVYPQSIFHQPIPKALQQAGNHHYQQSASEQLEDNIELQVRNTISELIGLGNVHIEQVATLLNLSPRALQRRLKAQNLEFRELVQDVRITFACWHLQASRCDITNLSDMLGYSDLSSFSRAFRRRMGLSPARWRQRVKSDTSASD